MGLFGFGKEDDTYLGGVSADNLTPEEKERYSSSRRQNQSDNEFTPRNSFNHISDDQDKKFGDRDKNDNKRDKAANGLKNGESFAAGVGNNVKKIMGMDGGSEEARQSENNIASGGGFKNMVSGRGGKDKGKGKFSFKNMMKKLAPALVAGGGVAGFGAMSFFGQMAMPFSLISQFQGNFDSIGTSANYRSTKFLNWQMDRDNRMVKDCIKSRIFGADKFKISKRQRSKLLNAGITVDDSGKFTVMKFTNSEGVEITVVPDSRQATGSNTVAFQEMYDTDQDFRDRYAQGSRTWRGAVGAWFDKLADKFLGYFGVSRGIWSRFKKGTTTDADMKAMRKTVSTEVGGNGHAKGGSNTTGFEQVNKENPDTHEMEFDHHEEHHTAGSLDISADDIDTDSNGKIKMETPEDIDSGKGSKLSNKLHTFGNSVAGKVTGYASAAASMTCAVLDVVGAINLVVAAYQTTQIIKVASGIFESIQKGQVEDSETTPIHAVANSLTLSSTRTYQYKDSANNYHEETRTRSAMESEAVRSIYGNTETNYNDASIRSFNLTNSIGAIATFLDIAAQSFKACAYAKLAAGLVDAIKDTIDIILCIVSFGIGCVVDAAIDAIVGIGTSVAISLIVSKIISILLPQIVQVLTRKIATDVMGEDLGNALVSGANLYMGQNHQYSGGSLANKDGLTRFLTLRDQVNADNARVARETLSPFDYTSPYTFMGTLLTKMMPVTVTASSAVQSVASFGNVFRSSISGLMPGASAVSAGVTAQEAANATEKHCPNLDSIGAVGDAFCNPYIVTDTRTLNNDPADVVNTVDGIGDALHPNFEDGEGDVPTIKKNSKLAKYIIYCGQRQSPFGMADNNIANDFQTSTGSQVGDSIIGAVPIVGDLFGALQEEEVLLNYGYVSGEACVIDNKKPALNAIYDDWGNNKEYQRFIEDQRLAENEGLVETSAVTAFLEEYYKEHPIDNSYEGILARRSGLTKDQVIATLDTMEFIAWQAGYDPSDYAPYVPEVQEEEHVALEETEDYGNLAIIPHLFFEEKRQKNFAV